MKGGKFLTKDGPKEKSYNFVKFLNIKKLTLDLQQDLDQETKESKISELEKINSLFSLDLYLPSKALPCIYSGGLIPANDRTVGA